MTEDSEEQNNGNQKLTKNEYAGQKFTLRYTTKGYHNT